MEAEWKITARPAIFAAELCGFRWATRLFWNNAPRCGELIKKGADMHPLGFLAVGTGAALGAWLRWGLSLWLNPRFATVPLGTLAANLLGGYLVGVAIALFGWKVQWAPEWRLFVVTGMMGGLTTFSTFSAEVVTLLERGQFGWAGLAACGHLLGSLLMTALGLATVRYGLVN